MAEAEDVQQSNPEVKEATEGSLLDQIIQETRILSTDEGYDVAQRGVKAFIAELLGPGREDAKPDRALIDQMIAEIDRKLSVQMDEVLHHESFQKLESAWRGLKLVVDRTNFLENIKVELLNISKAELLEDFEDAAEIPKSGLYQLIYTNEYATFGGQPIGAMIANYDFGPSAQDIKLLQDVASVGAMAHAPFIAAASPKFFGLDGFQELPNLKDLKAILEGPQFIKWQAFRESEDARYVGLTAPRFLLRPPYDRKNNPVKAFDYQESVQGHHDRYLWGNTAFAFATRLTDSFAQFRWCPNIIGPRSGGAVENLPLHQYESMGNIESTIPTECLISDRREFELAEEGFIALAIRKGSDNACFFSANSAQKAKKFGTSEAGKTAELNYKLGTQIPYMFIINRLAHYIKVLQREELGGWKERQDLERDLNVWIRQYVADQENPPPNVRSRRPLRQAQISVQSIEGEPGWYRVDVNVRPHFKYMGANFSLSLVGKLEPAKG
jgi:type VI secretion system protein ImpC